jgi:hypothetical protein
VRGPRERTQLFVAEVALNCHCSQEPGCESVSERIGVILTDPEPAPRPADPDRDRDPNSDPYPFPPNVKLNSLLFRRVQFSILYKTLEIMTPITLTKKTKQCRMALL